MRSRLVLVSLISLTWITEVCGQTPVGGLAPTGSTQVPFTFVPDSYRLWSGGALLAVQERSSPAPLIRVIGADGREIFQHRLQIPGAKRINIYDRSMARGPDGSLAIIGSAYTDDSRGATFLAWFSSDGREQTVVRLSPFAPHAVTVASDGTIWVAGYNNKEDPRARDYSQHLIRRYDRNGKLIGSLLPWSRVKPTTHTLPAAMSSILVSSPDRIGWLSRYSQTYIEFSLDGTVIAQFKAPEYHQHGMLNVALCDDGALFVEAKVNSTPQMPGSSGIFVLNREQQEWNLVRQEDNAARLYGCDGTRLATLTDATTITWLGRAKK